MKALSSFQQKLLIAVLVPTIIIGTCAILLAILVPIGVVNSVPPEYCFSTENLKAFNVGDVLTLSRGDDFKMTISFTNFTNSNETTKVGRMKYRSWAIPRSVDLMNMDEKGSAVLRNSGVLVSDYTYELWECIVSDPSNLVKFGHVVYDYRNTQYLFYNAAGALVAWMTYNSVSSSLDSKTYQLFNSNGDKIATITRPSMSVFQRAVDYTCTFQLSTNANMIDFRGVILMFGSIALK
ncbi:hypothetical protein FDP41_007166 [Naegleria fowleri]|uniref:Uncharacterized protein n=1 Tax=Naegleria fowleri TaxID=5763 RepID=A0A6A5BLJ9_NAEFO|nr:uncharacterized protein FDP41_007166 [Naegleria fowleri]KAF0973779.1 hypothetical protein FDP41_007166 [Naegleria fowleri]CAG4718154.1 unnamed protein product [Naegleria fowleri]